MPIDPASAAAILFVAVALSALSLAFFYGVTPLDHRFVVKVRRAILKYDYQRWPFRNVWPGLLPVGIALAFLLVGRVTEGRPWTMDQIDDVPEALLAVGLVWLTIGFVFMIRPPQRVLPAWYRTVDSHRRALPLRAVVMALDLVSEIESSRASIEAVMASAQAERSGIGSTSHRSPTAFVSEARVHLDAVTGQVPDQELVRLVEAWGRAFGAADAGPGAGFASALAVAPDADWQALTSASDALLAHLTRLHDTIARDLPQL